MDQPTLAYRWRAQQLHPVAHVHHNALDGLLGIDRQKQLLIENLRQFVAGAPANHVLLTGARGTGKSTLVRALLSEFAAQGLRLVEVAPQDLVELPDIVAPLRSKPERFVLFVDDFCVAANDRALTALKTALDGGVEAPAENVLIIATSNRRHLMPTLKSENAEFHWQDGELHPGESTEANIALSERFGLWLSFPAFDQALYLKTVQWHLQALGVHAWDEVLEKSALRWALNRASRSGRVAQQFARDTAGRLRLQQGQT